MLSLFSGFVPPSPNESSAELFAPDGWLSPSAASKDAALLLRLPPGSYTAVLRGADAGGGDALIEIYDVP